jgi:type III pantothenate kinase
VNSGLLAVNVGNTQTTIGVFHGETLGERWRLATKVARTPDELWLILRQFLDSRHDMQTPNAVSISSVVPDLTLAYAQMFESRVGVHPLVITYEAVHSLRIDYDPPCSVGPDRLCGAVAGFSKYGGPLVIVDLGTATVFDVITRDGVYSGGIISPGIMTAIESLHSATALLPRVELRFPDSIVGRTTEAAIQSGVLFGTIEMVDGMIRRIREAGHQDAKVIATGGLATLLSPRSATIQFVEPDLVLDGIRLITAQQ